MTGIELGQDFDISAHRLLKEHSAGDNMYDLC